MVFTLIRPWGRQGAELAWKAWRTATAGAARADRALIMALVAGALLGGALLWSHVSDRLRNMELGLIAQTGARAATLDMQMQVAIGHLEALRQRADFFYAEYPAPDDVQPNALFNSFMDSNPRQDAARPYNLDRLPPPYLVDQIGNLLALPVDAVNRDAALSRPDFAGWRQEAAMAVQILPLMAVTQRVVPQARRLYYASISGMVAIHPWVRSDQTDLPQRAGAFAPFAAVSPFNDLDGAARWTLVAEGERLDAVVAAIPLHLQGRYFGAMAVEMPLAGLAGPLGHNRDGAHMLVVDADGRVLAGRSGPGSATLPPHLGDLVRDPGAILANKETAITQDFPGPYVINVPLKQAPWQVVYVVPALGVLTPTLKDVLISVLGFVASVLVVLFVSRRLTLRALDVRDAAMRAEREARADVEKALTDLRAAHDELDFLNREKTRFFSLISHDLRGPFNSMLGMTQELADHAPKMRPEDTADFARSVHEMARKVFELLENLLQWSRVQMSGTPFAPAVFPMRDVVGDAIRDVASAAQGKDIQILDASGDRWVLADRTMVLAVLRNLLMNALKFSHQGGVVHVTSRALGDRLEVAVTDKGIGMEPAQLEQVLRGGAKSSRPGTQGETGTGLGLTLVRDLVLRHGGELKLESAPGRGTIASFTVPMTTDPAETRRLMARVAD